MSENKTNTGLCVVALVMAIVALFAGVVLPEAANIAVDLALGDLNNVDLTGPVANQTLTYNGSQWVNTTPDTYVNTTFGYDDLNFPALSLAKSASLTPNQAVVFASGGIQGLLFDGSTQVNEVFGSGEILHSYEQGSDLYPHVHWMPTTTDEGNVTWFLEYNVVNVNGVYSTPVTVNVSQSVNGTAWIHRVADFPAIDGSGLVIGSQIVFRLYRNATDVTDTYTANAALLSFGIHYKLDSVGSVNVSSK